MKHTFMKRCLAPFALLALLYLGGCTDLNNPSPAARIAGGTVAVRIGAPEARTLYPVFDAFSKYVLSFDGPAVHDDVEISGESVEIELGLGAWTITATAFTGTGEDAQATAQGSIAVTVEQDVSKPANITLGPITGAEAETGTFSYAITLPASAITATLSLTNTETQTAVPGSPFDLKARSSGTLDTASGYYLMHLQLTNAKGETAGLTEVVHIYSGLTTSTAGDAYDLSSVVWTTVTSVTVSPTIVNVAKGDEQTFSATVTGTNNPAQTVTWSVSGGADTTISAGGILSVAADESAATLTVTASSTVDDTKIGTAVVTVTADVVNTLNLTSLLTAPVRDAAPVTTAINTAQYTGTIAWQTSSGAAFTGGAFAPSTVYKALVTLSAKSGYTFAGVGENNFTYTDASSVTNSANSGTVTITFPATAAAVVNALNLSALVTTPLRGAALVTTPINTTQYTGTIAWQTSSGTAFSDGTFAPSTVYRAKVTLSAKSGYTFTGVAADSFTYTGATTVTNEANSGTLIITFPATGPALDVAVSDFNLTALLIVPAVTAPPVTTAINAAQYTGTIEWQTSSGAAFTGGAFAPSTVYKALVTLSAKSGYTFAGVGENNFTYTDASSVTNSANSGTVTITFPATAAAVVNALNLSALVTTPLRDAAPVTTAIDTAQYTGTVAWQASSGAAFTGGAFAAATVYEALVTLSAKSGYTFAGVTADSFTYTGATVTIVENSGTIIIVTITFPATGPALDIAVNDFDLTSVVIVPVVTATPVTTEINKAQYRGTIAWYTSNGALFTGGTFAASTVYKALVTLTAKPGYTFSGVSVNNFIHMGADTQGVTNGANSGTVTITFPATAAVGNVNITVGFNYGEITITGSDGSNVISKSGAYGSTSLSLSATGYTNVIWYVDGSPTTDISGSSVTLNAANYSAQRHSIIFTGTANGHRYSSQAITFTVLN